MLVTLFQLLIEVIKVDEISKLIRPNHIIVHYECCRCHAKSKELLSEITTVHDSLCNKCNKGENYIEIIGVSIKGKRLKLEKDIKLKKECFTCKIFDENQKSRLKCAVGWSCPGLDWNKSRKQRAIQRNGRHS